MKKLTIRITALAMALSLPLLLAGCNEQVLDYRNTEIVNGKVYEKGGNEPFTGKVTNLPINLITPIAKDIGAFNRDLKSLMAGDQYGAYFNPSHCDASVKKGVVEGDGTCFDRQGNVPNLKNIKFRTALSRAMLKYSAPLHQTGSLQKVPSAAAS